MYYKNDATLMCTLLLCKKSVCTFTSIFQTAVIFMFCRIMEFKVVMYMQGLYHFCNTSSPDDGPKLSRKYWGGGKKLIMEDLSTNSC